MSSSVPDDVTSMISVVIVTHNSEACLGACLATLAERLPGAERLVIDNASIDGTRALAARHGATVIELEHNIGFGRACNAGARRAKQGHVLFLNPDVRIGAVDLDALASLLETVPFGLVAPSATSTFTFPERPWLREALAQSLGPLRPRALPERAPRPRSGQAVWASGAALLVRVSEFLGTGGFDSRYFMYFEDRDLSWRYRASGLPVRTTRALAGDHMRGSSSEVGDRPPELLAYSLVGLLQYTHAVHGPSAAGRAWRLAHGIYAASMCAVGAAARIVPSARLRRKRAQLGAVMRELSSIGASAGVLKRSDDHAYWPDAVPLLGKTERVT